MGANSRAKANAATAILELVQIATNQKYEENNKVKHRSDAKNDFRRLGIPIVE